MQHSAASALSAFATLSTDYVEQPAAAGAIDLLVAILSYLDSTDLCIRLRHRRSQTWQKPATHLLSLLQRQAQSPDWLPAC